MPRKNTTKIRKRFHNKSKSKRKTKKLKERVRIKDEIGTRVQHWAFDLYNSLNEHMMDVFEFEFIKMSGERIIILRDVRYLFFSQWEEFIPTTLPSLTRGF